MTQFLDTPVDKSLSATGAWTDIDLSSDVPTTATGAIFRVKNNSGVAAYFGLRNNGSTDTRTGDVWAWDQLFVIIGVDSNRKCEGYIETTDVDFFLIGYTEADATFFTNGVDKSIGTTGTWTDIDVSANIPSGSVAAVFVVVNTHATQDLGSGLRKNGSTDNRTGDLYNKTQYWLLVGVDSNRKCEGYIETTDVDFYLIGYLTQGQAETNAHDRSLVATGSYVDIDESSDAPSGATGVFGEVLTNSDYKFAARKKGTSLDFYDSVNTDRDGLFAGLDANRKWEGKIENTDVDFYILGYFAAGIVEKNSSDVGVGVDSQAELLSSRSEAETGGGVDAESPVEAALIHAETGIGIDNILTSLSSRIEAETGAGTDTLVSLLKVIAKFSSDTGVGVDALSGVLADLIQAEDGSGIEAVSKRDLSSVDVGGGSDALSSLLAELKQAEIGVGQDAWTSLLAAIANSDTGQGIESSVVRMWIYLLLKLLQGRDKEGGYKSYLPGYRYRKIGSVNATVAGAQTDCQLELVVGESSDVSGAGVHCNEHCEDFPNDLRFTKEDGLTKHDYWIDASSLEGTTPNRKVSVWIEVAVVPSSGSVDFYMYYGKSSDSGESDGDDTFEFFDDFESESESVEVSWARISTDVYGNGVYPPQGPIGVYVSSQSKTYMVWQTADCGRKIVEYDHAAGALTNETSIGGSKLASDGHGGPALVIDSSGYLYVFYGSHNSNQYYKKSSNPYDVTGWSAEQTAAGIASYPQPFYTDSKLWLFYRHDSPKEWCFKTSSDGGVNWSVVSDITNFSGLAGFWGVYARTMKAPNGDIHMAWLWRDGSNVYNIYYAYYDITVGQWKKRNGTILTIPILESDAEKVFSGNDTWIWGLDIDPNNEPYILFAYSGDDKLKIAKWKGGAWQTFDVTGFPHIVNGSWGALKVDSATEMRIVKVSNDYKTAELYKSVNSGETWAFDKIIGEEIPNRDYKIGAGYHTVFNANSEVEFLYGPGPGSWPATGGRCAMWGEGSNFTHMEEMEGGLSNIKWETIAGAPEIIAGKLHIDDDERIKTKTWTGLTTAIECKAEYPNEIGATVYSILGLSDNVDKEGIFLTYWNWDVRSRTDAGSEVTTIGAFDGGHRFKIVKNGSAELRYYIDDILKDTDTVYVPSASLPLLFFKKGENALIVDWVFARSYVSPEPTWGVWGAEEVEDIRCLLLKLLQKKELKIDMVQEKRV